MFKMNHERKKKKKIHPSQFSSEDEGLVNYGYEMEDYEKNNNFQSKFRSLAEKLSTNNPLNVIANVRQGISKWKHYSNTRRQKNSLDDGAFDRRKTGGIGLTEELGESKDVPDGDLPAKKTDRQYVIAKNRNLIQYFAQLGKHVDKENKSDFMAEDNVTIDLDLLDKLLKDGARVNCTDRYGQTCLHEVARAWHVDVAKFLLEHGAKINQADSYGRTPLHIAAAVDYAEMVEFLIKHGAEREVITNGEHQTPLHFAAKNDACQSLKMLMKLGCKYKEVRDYKGRTPLHLAAELDRSETARMLLECADPAPAGVEDHSGQAAIVWMITKMPPVAKLALDQFHRKDRANRKQYYHLHRLEPRKEGCANEGNPQTALQVAVAYRRFDLIIHPMFVELISVKWARFARLRAWLNTILNFTFILLWTVQGILVEYDQRYHYILPQQWWRIVLFILALGLTVWQICEELREFFHSKKVHKNWKEWREAEINRDIKFSHPRWPEEEQYLITEIDDLDKIRPQYLNDFWNIFDWIVYALLLVVIITHLVDIVHHTEFTARLHIRIMAVTIILLWLRLMKNARAFSTLGPFIVMLSHMVGDILKFGFLYLEFFIPYACAFWMIFGGDKVPESKQGQPDAANHTVTVGGYENPNALLFSMFRLTVVDDYDYDGMKSVDSIMADILVGTWLALSAILCLNLFIALLSDTFQRVYDNAQANAVMQKAITILNIEEGLSHKRRENFRRFIHTKCGPLMDFYDDDTTEMGEEDLKKVTIQIKEDLDELREQLDLMHKGKKKNEDMDDLREKLDGFHDNKPGGGTDSKSKGTGQYISTAKFEKEVGQLRSEIQDIRDRQEDLMDCFKMDMSAIKSLLQGLAAQAGTGTREITGSRSSSRGSRRATLSGTVPDRQPTDTIRSQSAAMATHAPSTDSTLRQSIRRTDHHDQDWEMSERQRKKDLDKLRKHLAQQTKKQAASDDESYDGLEGTYQSAPVVEVSEFQPSTASPATQDTEVETKTLPKVKVRSSSKGLDGKYSSDA